MGYTLPPEVKSKDVPFARSGIEWHVCRTAEQLEPFARELADQKKFAWDVETNGRSPYTGRRIIGHSAAWRRPNGQVVSFYAPCRHEGCGMSLFDDLTQIEPEVVSSMLKPALEGPATKIGHNISFDISFGWADGINTTGPVIDTLLAYRIYNENLRNYALHSCLKFVEVPHEHGWKTVVNDELHRIAKFLKVKIGWLKNNHGHGYVPIEIEGRYGCQDAAYELMLGEYLEARNFWPETWDLEMDLLWCCLDIEKVGVPLDGRVLEDLRETCRQEMQHLTPKIWSLAGEEYQITNDNELRRILFRQEVPARKGKGPYPVQGETKSKLPSVDDDTLWSLEKHFGSELAKLQRQYNSFDKIYSTYSTSIVDLMDPGGVLHGEVRQAGAKTGRVAMAKPNLTNIPVRTALGRRVREAFIARHGWVRYCLDYCLTGDTEVLTLTGPQPIRDVVKSQTKVLSCSPDGQFAFKAVERAAKIGRKKVVDLELDDGTRVRCTGDHEWMRFDGSMSKTSDLRPGDRLRHVRQGCSGRYPTWWWRSNREYTYCHRLVAREKYGPCPHGYEVDHLDDDPNNWGAGNLIYKTIKENRGEAAGNWWRKATLAQREEKKRQLAEGVRHRRRSYRGEGNPNYGKRKGVDVVCLGCGVGFYQPPSRKAKYCSQECYRSSNNFKVVAVHPVGIRTVYHLTVADWHTFVLGNGLVSGNSQVELRALAHLSQDPTLMQIYFDDLDAHAATAVKAFGSSEKVNGIDMRRVAKSINFGVSFGMTPPGMCRNFNKELPDGAPEITEPQAEDFFSEWNGLYRGIGRYRSRLVHGIKRQNCEFVNLFGRPQRVPELNHKHGGVVRAAERQSIARMVQGTAADLVKRCMLASWQYLKAQTRCEGYMVLMVHDELQFDLAPGGSSRTIRDIHKIMEQTCQSRFSVPLKVDVEYFTTHWGEKKGLTL